MAEKFEYTREWTDAEAFPLLGFTKSWENPEDYPTIELDETQVRKDMQSLHDEVKNYINDKLIPAVLAEDATEAARAAAEAQREVNETQRIENENARIAAEQARVDETNGVVAQANQAAQSWAVGGTGTREGEDTNNAKYWSDKAREAAGGDFVPTSEKGAANGVATLGADALLAAAQRPKAGGLYRDDGTTTLEASLAEISTTLQKKAESDSVYAKTETDALLANKAVFGLCEGIYNFNTNSELEAKLSELFYGMTDGSVRYWRFNMLAVFEPFGGGVWMLELTKLSENRCIARMSDSGGKVLVLRKDGSWGVWEWVNPPMHLGVEYRTTERYRGKPVYQKLIDFGALPNNTQKDVSIFASGETNTMECGIDVKLISHNNQAYKTTNTLVLQVLQTGGVTVKTNYNDSATSVYALCYYTKTTD